MRLNLEHRTPNAQRRMAKDERPMTRAPLRAFTMVEIAIALGIIGFALVAIIGILPAGLQVQKETRERSIMDKEAELWINAIKGGEYYHAYTNFPYLPPDHDLYQFVDKIQFADGMDMPGSPSLPYANSVDVIGLLSRTNGVAWTDIDGNRVLTLTEPMSAIVRPLNGAAIERGAAFREDFAFTYRMNVHITPSWSIRPDHPQYVELQNKLWEMKLEFAWPILPNGQALHTQAVYRASIAGDVWVNDSVNPSIWFFRP